MTGKMICFIRFRVCIPGFGAILETDGETLLGERDERVSQLCMLLWQLRKSFNEIPIHGRCYIGGLSVAYPLKSLMVLHKTKMKINK